MSGMAAAAQRGIKRTGRTTGNNNKEGATTEAEKRANPKDRKEEAETAKKETGGDYDLKEAFHEREDPTTKQPKIRRETKEGKG